LGGRAATRNRKHAEERPGGIVDSCIVSEKFLKLRGGDEALIKIQKGEELLSAS